MGSATPPEVVFTFRAFNEPTCSISYRVPAAMVEKVAPLLHRLAGTPLPDGPIELEKAILDRVVRTLRIHAKDRALRPKFTSQCGTTALADYGGAILTIQAGDPLLGETATKSARALLRLLLPTCLVAAVGLALFKTDQGRDLLRTAGDGPAASIRLMLALILPIGVALSRLPDFMAGSREVEGTSEPPTRSPWREEQCVRTLVGVYCGFLVGAPVWSIYCLSNFSSTTAIAIVPLALCAVSGVTTGFIFVGLNALMAEQRRWTRWLRRYAGFLIVGGVACFPAPLGELLGTPIILGLALSGWLLILASMFTLARHWRFGGEVLVVALLVAAPIGYLLSEGPRVDDIQGVSKAPASARSLNSALAASVQGQVGTPTVVIVAAAGGGIRASYWTSKVLTRMTDRSPGTQHKVLVASGVSGGSLGLALYRALLGHPQADCNSAGRLEDCVTEFHRRDFLAGALAASTTGEIFNSLVTLFPIRSRALEATWEARWREISGGDDTFARSFRSPENLGLPSLVLNTTNIRNAERVPISDLETDGWLASDATCKVNISDRVDLSLSAAANASARFPYMEEWARFPVGKARNHCQDEEAIADGGFNDNYGAATALDALRAVRNAPGAIRPHIVVIQITSDTDCESARLLGAQSFAADCLRAQAEREKSLVLRPIHYWPPSRYNFADFYANSLLPLKRLLHPPPKDSVPSPLELLMSARSLNGSAVALALRQETCSSGNDYFLFSLSGAFDVPLGWALSGDSRKELDGLLDRGPNAEVMNALVERLTTGAGRLHSPGCGDAAPVT